jgi:hypothetical protein
MFGRDGRSNRTPSRQQSEKNRRGEGGSEESVGVESKRERTKKLNCLSIQREKTTNLYTKEREGKLHADC